MRTSTQRIVSLTDELQAEESADLRREKRMSGLVTEFSEVSVGLLARYMEDPALLSNDERELVQGWEQRYEHVRDNLEENRKYGHFFKGPQLTLSDV